MYSARASNFCGSPALVGPCQLQATSPLKARAIGIAAGQSYLRKAGVEHDVRNETTREIVFVEIEVKPTWGA